jgi:hypothetical protein
LPVAQNWRKKNRTYEIWRLLDVVASHQLSQLGNPIKLFASKSNLGKKNRIFLTPLNLVIFGTLF